MPPGKTPGELQAFHIQQVQLMPGNRKPRRLELILLKTLSPPYCSIRKRKQSDGAPFVRSAILLLIGFIGAKCLNLTVGSPAFWRERSSNLQGAYRAPSILSRILSPISLVC